MSLRNRITEDMKAAMRAKEGARLAAIRLLLAAIKQREVDERVELSDSQIIEVVEKMLKQRRDSISQYEAAARYDLAEAERFEVGVLSAYLPQPLSDAEISALVDSVLAETGAVHVRDMGKVMAVLKPRIVGRADVGKVSGMVKARLGG
ncbi:MAG: GatB/YqeY domain-containing protein [Methylophilaceae bacterium]|nr:GatB/YqeY domain-containing protein [Methylophilaceae bacterium]